MDRPNRRLNSEQRARLGEKGRILYRKSCGATNGKNTCAESFAIHHINRGEQDVARDLLVFLDSEAEILRLDDPERRLQRTVELAARIRAYLERM
jgi:hypothetical protein